MNKILILPALVFLVISIVSAGISVEPGETLTLPQVNALEPHTLDLSGTERTYLFCTWELGDLGEDAVTMSGNVCPATAVEHTFEDSVPYFVSIDYAEIHWDQNIEEWVIDDTGVSASIVRDYVVDIPEPPEGFFDSIIQDILNLFHSLKCGLMPWLDGCST